jgi:hypothetical protein
VYLILESLLEWAAPESIHWVEDNVVSQLLNPVFVRSSPHGGPCHCGRPSLRINSIVRRPPCTTHQYVDDADAHAGRIRAFYRRAMWPEYQSQDPRLRLCGSHPMLTTTKSWRTPNEGTPRRLDEPRSSRPGLVPSAHGRATEPPKNCRRLASTAAATHDTFSTPIAAQPPMTTAMVTADAGRYYMYQPSGQHDQQTGPRRGYGLRRPQNLVIADIFGVI